MRINLDSASAQPQGVHALKGVYQGACKAMQPRGLELPGWAALLGQAFFVVACARNALLDQHQLAACGVGLGGYMCVCGRVLGCVCWGFPLAAVVQ